MSFYKAHAIIVGGRSIVYMLKDDDMNKAMLHFVDIIERTYLMSEVIALSIVRYADNEA